MAVSMGLLAALRRRSSKAQRRSAPRPELPIPSGLCGDLLNVRFGDPGAIPGDNRERPVSAHSCRWCSVRPRAAGNPKAEMRCLCW